jgi:hypothetical protein
MDLTIELSKLKAYMDNRDTNGFKASLKALYEKSNPDEKEMITSFVENELSKSTNRIENTVKDIQIRMQLENAIDILPLSYISKNYFNKTRQWLYQRINGNTINGRLAKFTATEIDTFNFALQDISKRIGSITIHP